MINVFLIICCTIIRGTSNAVVSTPPRNPHNKYILQPSVRLKHNTYIWNILQRVKYRLSIGTDTSRIYDCHIPSNDNAATSSTSEYIPPLLIKLIYHHQSNKMTIGA